MKEETSRAVNPIWCVYPVVYNLYWLSWEVKNKSQNLYKRGENKEEINSKIHAHLNNTDTQL